MTVNRIPSLASSLIASLATGLLLASVSPMAIAQQAAVGTQPAQRGADNTITSTAGTISPGSADRVEAQSKSGYYRKNEDGWFWYEDPPPPTTAKPKEPPPEAAPAEKKDQPLTVEWIRENLDRLRDKAINEPTTENISMYLYVQKYAMDKAEKFAYTYRGVAEGDAALDESIDNPSTAVTRMALNEKQDEAMNSLVSKITGEVGIWYFFKSDCVYCARQNPILKMLQADIPQISIMPISLDNQPMPDGMYPNWVSDNGQAAQLAISSTPSLFLVRPPNQVVQLAVGTRSLPELKQRIVEVANAQGWITKQEYDIAMHGLPRRLLTDGLQEGALRPGATDAEILDALKGAGIYGGHAAKIRPAFDGEGGATPLTKD